MQPTSPNRAPPSGAAGSRAAAGHHLSRGTAGLGPARGHRTRNPRAPDRHRQRRDGLGEDHAVAEDLPDAGTRRGGRDWSHAAAPHCRVECRATDRAGAGHAARRRGRLQGALQRRDAAGRFGQADDGRHPARRVSGRPAAHAVRHADHRRGARALAQHRLSARLSQAAAAAPARSESDHHFGDDRCRALRAALRIRGGACSGYRGVRTAVPGRGALPAGRRRRRCG